MIDNTVIARAAQLKKEKEAAYLVFKKEPSVANATVWTLASRAYNDYCIKAMDALVEEHLGQVNRREDILANFESYRRCSQCEAELLFPTHTSGEGASETVTAFVASSDFVEDFPGWCYPCLVNYCKTHTCSGCPVSSNPTNCTFAEVRNLHVPREA